MKCCIFLLLFLLFNSCESVSDKIIKEATNTTEKDIKDQVLKELNKTIEDSNKVDSATVKKIESEVDKYINLILSKKIKDITSLIEFPLDLESSNAFGFNESSEELIKIEEQEFQDNFDHFFKKPFLDSLKNNAFDIEIFHFNGKNRFRIHVNTFDPANKEREWGIECGHQMVGFMLDSTIKITNFGLLCGGIM